LDESPAGDAAAEGFDLGDFVVLFGTLGEADEPEPRRDRRQQQHHPDKEASEHQRLR